MQKMGAKVVIDRLEEDIGCFISLQGSIGAGKSTVLKAIRQYLKTHHLSAEDVPPPYATEFDRLKHGPVGPLDYFLVVDEPLDAWTREIYSTAHYGEEGVPLTSLLSLFYTNPSLNGFLFQINAFMSRLKGIIDSVSTLKEREPGVRVHIIAERSLRTDALFFRNLYESGVVREVEWDVYQAFFPVICTKSMEKETVMVYLNTSPGQCYDRVNKRHRKAETTTDSEEGCGITEDYLTSLGAQHDRMVKEFRDQSGNTVIDMDFEANMDESQIETLVGDLMRRLIEHTRSVYDTV
jgi:deoxyadenosine/deoxycytidine kinase